MDAHNGMGMVASYKMMEMLIEKAKTYGVAVGSVFNSTHYGTVFDLSFNRDKVCIARSLLLG